LSQDLDARVRDWSTFGLGTQLEVDTPEILAALLARVEDIDADTRAEALAGLAKRRDLRVVVPLRRALESGTVGSLEVEAAGELGSGQLLDALEKLRSWWNVDRELLENAISRCSGGPDRAG
jgi:HEAT repeat protein